MLAYGKSQSLWNRAGLSTLKSRLIRVKMTFQSLWRRAESFDIKLAVKEMFRTNVSIPLEQGGVFRLRGWFGALMDKAWEDRFPTFPLMRKVRYGFD